MKQRVPEFVILSLADDWEALYIDGELVLENHQIRVYDVMFQAEKMGLLHFRDIEDWTIIDDESGESAPAQLPEEYK